MFLILKKIFNHFFYLVKAKPISYCIGKCLYHGIFRQVASYLSKNAMANFRTFPYLDFELSFPPLDKTGDFAILSDRRFKNKTAVKVVIKYKFKSRN